jgi:DNA-directed RNA polymerase subunit RPC12/RpoP
MSKNKENGDAGEIEVCELVPCPNCGKKLMTLPKNYPLYDVQCEGCSFRAQVKTNSSKPKSQIFGAGWDIMEKVLKSGFLTPPLVANFKWKDKEGEHQEIFFYPFVPKKHLKMHQLSSTAKRANYKMFNYVNLDKIPFFLVYSKLNKNDKNC